MKNTFIQKTVFLLVLFFSSVVLSHGTVIITNVEHNKGYIDVKIYDSKDSFLKEDQAVEAVRKKVNKGEVVVPLSKIHDGQIAIVVYHDEDSNGELKTGLFWRPKEGFAFSNNYNPKGPPKFKKAAIMLEHGVPVEIELNY
ncbi:MAG: DUF2141 domain-containing protein [Pelagibacteraceae bacterium]|jgi:uncharacterized protein (DUF2141 family)|nr:DUF2141 domain-containing protein [Pelagibacteraceae bacterium]MBT5214635.1 DUF2141 domain-containing protein [Pelagibacteraceae bacterium]MBT6198290.1 DUF2141 domain-containing protein [Pelagibacteraceae bacterium]